MPTFVHIADERDARAIRRTGLSLPRGQWRGSETSKRKQGVFALPVVEDFMISHQWVRELKRRGHRVAVGVYFKVPDDEMVWAGLYNEEKKQVTAAQSAATLRAKKPLGYEVVIPRSIAASQISAIRRVPSVGWRFFPNAKGRGPFCLCKFCNRGGIKNKRMRSRLDPAGVHA